MRISSNPIVRRLSRLRKNIQTLSLDDRCKIVPSDLFRWFSQPQAHDQARLIFLDPPYRFLREHGNDLRTLVSNLAAHLTSDGMIIFRHDANDELALPGLALTDRRDYGSMAIEILRPATPA